MTSEKSRHFVDFAISGINSENKGFRSQFARADNPNTEYQCWDLLARWVDLEDQQRRNAYALIGASLARVRATSNGTLGLGTALHRVLRERAGNESMEVTNSPRLRRILACKDRRELSSVLRSTMKLIESKDLILDYARLLDELLWFDSEGNRDRTIARWAQEFYGRREQEE